MIDGAGKKFLRASLMVAGVIAAVLALMVAFLAVMAVVLYGANVVFSLPLLALVLFAVALVMHRAGKKSFRGETSVDDRLFGSVDYEARGGLKRWGKVMDKVRKKSLRDYLVIAAVIAAAMYVVVLLPHLALLILALVLLPLALVMDIAGKKFPRASLVIAAMSAAAFYVADAFSFFLAPYALLLFAVVLLYFLPAALWALRTDHRVARFRAAKAAIYCIAAVSTVLTIDLQNRMADRRAVKLGDACLAYRAKYHHYPMGLDALVPEFIPSVPAPRYSLGYDSFSYSPAPNYSLLDGGHFSYDLQKEPQLYYELFPPFGRRFYHMESRKWGYLD